MKLAKLKRSQDFEAFVLRLFASKNPAWISGELQQQMGMSFDPKIVAQYLTHPNVLGMAIATQFTIEHPEEALTWLAMFEGSSNMISQSIYRQVFDRYPHITAESLAATLPAGIHREHVLGIFRSQHDPIAEAARELTTPQDAKDLQSHLWQLADQWPKDKQSEGIRWAVAHLQGEEFNAFVPKLLGQFSIAQPDETLSFLSQLTDAKQLSLCVTQSLSGIVSTHHRPRDLLPLLDRLDGDARSFAVSRLASVWVRADQHSLIEWLNTIDTPADFDAALPTTLPQLTEENYQHAISTLMAQLDPSLEAALIRTAMPSLSPSARSKDTSMDIINRLVSLPQYREIGSGLSGNQELLWQAVSQNAASWVSRQAAAPAEAARWIDNIPFRTPADKAVVAAKLYSQWKLSDPTAAAEWARTAGVVVK